jgi:hypothetical protein
MISETGSLTEVVPLFPGSGTAGVVKMNAQPRQLSFKFSLCAGREIVKKLTTAEFHKTGKEMRTVFAVLPAIEQSRYVEGRASAVMG